MSRLLLFSLTMVLAAAVFAGCAKTEPAPATNPKPADANTTEKPAG